MTTETLIVNIALTVTVLVILGFFFYLKMIDVFRYKKHKFWYNHYNRALRNSMCIGSQFSEKINSINEQIKLMQQKLLDGGCLADDYREAMKSLAAAYCDAVSTYKNSEVALGIEDDLKKADAYAKEHNLKWGILYE